MESTEIIKNSLNGITDVITDAFCDAFCNAVDKEVSNIEIEIASYENDLKICLFHNVEDSESYGAAFKKISLIKLIKEHAESGDYGASELHEFAQIFHGLSEFLKEFKGAE